EVVVEEVLMADAIKQCIRRGVVTKEEAYDLSRLYNKYPEYADNAIKRLTRGDLAQIIALLEKTKEGKATAKLWGFRDRLKELVGSDTADEIIDFWIKEHGKVVTTAAERKSFFQKFFKKIYRFSVLSAVFLGFEAGMDNYVLRDLGLLPKRIEQKWDDAYWNMVHAINALEQDPNDEDAKRNAQLALGQMQSLIEYVEEHPPPRDTATWIKEAAWGLFGAGIGTAQEETLASWKLSMEIFQNTYNLLTGEYLIEPLPSEITVAVKEIIDGDTFTFSYGEKVYQCRLLGINTPEGSKYRYWCTDKTEPYLVRRLVTPGEECISEQTWHVDNKFYHSSIKWLSDQIPPGTLVTLKSDLENQWDRLGRLLAVVYKDSTDVCKEALKAGYAVVFFPQENALLNIDDYLAAENVARSAEIGVWEFGPVGVIKCISHPTAAEVWLDDKYTGHKTEGGVYILEDVKVGTHTVTFKKIIDDIPHECSVTVTVTEENTIDNPAVAECTLTPIEEFGDVECTTDPSGAEIWVGDEYYGLTKKTITLPVGTTTITFKKSGFLDCHKTVTVKKEKLVPAHCDLQEIPEPKAIWHILQAVDEEGNPVSGAKIYVDGIYVHRYTPRKLEFCPDCTCDTYVSCDLGVHTVTVKKKDLSWSKTRTLEVGDEVSDTPVLTAAPPATKICEWIAGLGGWDKIGSYDITQLILAYIGIKDLGFEVISSYVAGAILYYNGLKESGNRLTGCDF
ncbi:MAG: PEGA domain-containing protein, partial [Candidatus Syntropharchaeia archaeon]